MTTLAKASTRIYRNTSDRTRCNLPWVVDCDGREIFCDCRESARAVVAEYRAANSFAAWDKALLRQFAKYGFIASPLSPAMRRKLYRAGYDLDSAYGVGCDVNSGFPFSQLINPPAWAGLDLIA